MQIYLNISGKAKFMKNFKLLTCSVYSHLRTQYAPNVNGKPIGSLELGHEHPKFSLQDHYIIPL